MHVCDRDTMRGILALFVKPVGRMITPPIVDQPQSTRSLFALMPDEFVRYEYTYKPGCCCFTSKTTTVTNMRLITRTVKTPSFWSNQTTTGQERESMVFVTDIHNAKQIRPAIPTSEMRWWLRIIELLTCSFAHEKIDWLESCRDAHDSSMQQHVGSQPFVPKEKF